MPLMMQRNWKVLMSFIQCRIKTSNTVKVNAIDGKAEIPVRNNAGTMLPSTGGNGGIVFTIVGVAIIGVMMVSSLVSKKPPP